MTRTAADAEAGLQAFVGRLPKASATAGRTLAHAWTLSGGALAPGEQVTRLVIGDPPFTAATLRATDDGVLELSRAILEHHGVDRDAWLHWCDELADLHEHGLDPHAKFPTVRLAALGAGDLARLASRLRDLAKMVPP